jgi:hypothetical protein
MALVTKDIGVSIRLVARVNSGMSMETSLRGSGKMIRPTDTESTFI